MTSPVVSAKSVELDYPVYSFKSRSLRYSVANLAIGGGLMKTKDDTLVIRALKGVTFDLFDGDRLALVGMNGAGKSTLLRVIAGVYPPVKGSIEIQGTISSMLDITQGLDPEATGVENIKALSAMKGYSPWRLRSKIEEIVEFSGLGGYINIPVRTYSSGMSARLLFSVATAFDSDVLLLEEWLSAGDAQFIAKATERMNQLVDSARVIITATHSMDLVKNVCNKVLGLDHGEVRFFGSLEEYLALDF